VLKNQSMKVYGRGEVKLHEFLASTLDGGQLPQWSFSHLTPVPIGLLMGIMMMMMMMHHAT